MTRIIQISDTHIVEPGKLAYGRVDTALALKRTIDYINNILIQVGPIDAVVFTGDLTDSGHENEYELFKTILASLNRPYYAIPGNHDLREPFRKAFAETEWMPKLGPINWVLPFEDLVIIGLDCLVEGEPFGKLGQESFDFLHYQLNQFSQEVIVVAVHHPPFQVGIQHMDIQRMMDPEREKLLRVLRRDQRQVSIICGHLHRSIFSNVKGINCIVAPAPAHAVNLDLRPNGPAEYSFDPGGFLLHEVRENLVSQTVLTGPHGGPYPFFNF